MTDLIYYKHDGRIHGPLAISKIRKIVELGQCGPTDQWSTDGLVWQSINSLGGPSEVRVSVPSHHEHRIIEPLPTKTNPLIPTPFPQKFPVKAFGIKHLGGLIAVILLILVGFMIFRNKPVTDPLERENPDQGGQIPGAAVNNPGKVAGPFNRKELLDKHGKSVALLRRITDMGEVVGSGFLFKAGYLMTTLEVAGEDRGLLISVTFPGGNGDERGPHQARIHHLDQGMAILRLDAPQGPIPFSGTGLLKANEDLVVLASPGFSDPKSPLALEATNATYVTTTQKKELEYHRISGKTRPSKAGAPVLDGKGTVVGMVASPIPANDPLCITSKQILKILKDVNLP